ncbi:hypothetical protein PABG_04541 [Paracoccidioides brasiliensis Pb03]|nr:hypothetical protein PABG_04541 [Paracoccidioides brasiliensis Pb03]
MPSSTKQEEVYHPQDAIAATVKTTLISGAVGLFASSVQNTLQKRNYGPWGVFTRTGGTIALFAFHVTGGWDETFANAVMCCKGHANEEDEFARRERLRKNYRSPIEETVAQLGEGRGIHGVNYEERRRQRIKEHYGIDVPAAPQPAGP